MIPASKWREAILTLLGIDLLLAVEVDAENEDVGHNVANAHGSENSRVFKGDLLRCLHEEEDDEQIRDLRAESGHDCCLCEERVCF